MIITNAGETTDFIEMCKIKANSKASKHFGIDLMKIWISSTPLVKEKK